MTTTLRATAAAALTALVLSGCGDSEPSEDERRQAESAALDAVGEGRISDIGKGDDDDRYAFEVEVTTADGQDVDVELDESFAVLNAAEIEQELAASRPSASPSDDGDDASDDPTTDPGDDASSSAGTTQADDDTPLRGADRRKAVRAALAEVGGGRVTEATYADPDEDHAYEVEVERGNDDDVTVELDRRFRVTRVDD